MAKAKVKYVVETGIAIPPIKRPMKVKGRETVYPWRKVKVGQSFHVPGAKIEAMASLASAYGKRHDMKFTCRTMDGGVRVFRIA